jgi:surfeit locus 1 family protein
MSFKFLLPATLITIMVVFLTTLGFWQLDRADEKRAIEKAIEIANTGTVEIATSLEGLDEKEYYHLRLNGHYVSGKQFIYDNQIVQQTSGYYVLTPFKLENQSGAIVINRGFIPWNGDREKLADISIDKTKSEIKVQISKPIKRIELKPSEISNNFPTLIQAVDLVKMSEIAGVNFSSMVGLLDASMDDGFVRKWEPYTGSIEKHIGYAVQWFLMAIVLGIIGIRIAIKQRKK